MAEIPQLRADGRNWTDYREKILRVAAQKNLDRLYDGTETLQGDAEDWQQRNAIAKALIVETIPDSIFLRILHYESAHKFFEALKNLFEKDVATLELLQELRNNRSKREATYGLESANDRVRRRSHVTDASRYDDDDSNRSVRRNDHVPNGNTRRPERKREPKRQGRVEKRPGVGEEGRESRGRDDERVAAASEPGNGATDQTTSGVSLVKPTSSQGSLPEARVDSPLHHHNSKSPSPSPTTPNLPFGQTAPTSTRPAHQQRRNGHVPCNGTRRTREDVEWSRRGAESSNRGSREPDDEDGKDVDIHRADVAPQQPQAVGQTAVDDEAADTTDPHANSAGPAVPVGTTNEPSNGIDEGVEEGDRKVEEEDEKGGRASESAALSSNDNGGDEDVRHAYVVPKPATSAPYHVPPSPDKRRPPSVPLEGEMTGKQSSGHADEAATHLERPPDESTTQLPGRTPYDQTSNGEGRGEAVNGDDEVEVEGSNDGRDTSNRVDEWRRREVEQRHEDVQNEEEEGRTAAMNANANGQYTSNEAGDLPPEPPPFPHHPALPPPSPIHPERPDDVDTAKSNRMAARRRADD
ncbi:hypothetical protein PAXINDRAFT_21861, partial [Paxillus involutus ATCC 200175]